VLLIAKRCIPEKDWQLKIVFQLPSLTNEYNRFSSAHSNPTSSLLQFRRRFFLVLLKESFSRNSFPLFDVVTFTLNWLNSRKFFELFQVSCTSFVLDLAKDLNGFQFVWLKVWIHRGLKAFNRQFKTDFEIDIFKIQLYILLNLQNSPSRFIYQTKTKGFGLHLRRLKNWHFTL
jgi:hypothetical protein